jgi:hypothetical protein
VAISIHDDTGALQNLKHAVVLHMHARLFQDLQACLMDSRQIVIRPWVQLSIQVAGVRCH